MKNLFCKFVILFIILLTTMCALPENDFDLHNIKCEERGAIEKNPTEDNNSSTGVFIPNTLDEAMQEIDHMIQNDLKIRMRSEHKACMGKYHFTLGRFFRNEWQLLGQKTPLYQQFKNNGIKKPDDISTIILMSYWSYIRGNKVELKREISWWKNYIKKVRAYRDDLN